MPHLNLYWVANDESGPSIRVRSLNSFNSSAKEHYLGGTLLQKRPRIFWGTLIGATISAIHHTLTIELRKSSQAVAISPRTNSRIDHFITNSLECSRSCTLRFSRESLVVRGLRFCGSQCSYACVQTRVYICELLRGLV